MLSEAELMKQRPVRFPVLRLSAAVCLLLAACFLTAGCSRKASAEPAASETAPSETAAPRLVQTWASFRVYAPEDLNWPAADYSLPENFFPWTGTVSHHQLTDRLIDDWFAQIQLRRDVKTFFIICPSHYGLSTQDYSVANCVWNCAEDGYVNTNLALAEKVCENLGVAFDSGVFPVEHGASCLMPYLKKYFPEADVVVIAVDGEPPINMLYVQKLNEGLSPFFTGDQKKENFLIISSDFSHHGTESKTAEKDATSMIFFNEPKPVNFLACGCDNRPGMYVLANNLSERSSAFILYHTNSFVLSGMDETDITSYYFTLFD